MKAMRLTDLSNLEVNFVDEDQLLKWLKVARIEAITRKHPPNPPTVKPKPERVFFCLKFKFTRKY